MAPVAPYNTPAAAGVKAELRASRRRRRRWLARTLSILRGRGEMDIRTVDPQSLCQPHARVVY